MPFINITVNGRRAVTAQDIADAAGVSLNAAHKIISRSVIAPVAKLGFVYDADAAAALLIRPGKGAPGKPKPHRSVRESKKVQQDSGSTPIDAG